LAPSASGSFDQVTEAADVLVSVLVPVLNEEAHLPQAARAMLAQELDGAAEFIFIDGGSTDASAQILRQVAAEHRNVLVLANPHRRTPHALNIGLAAARGRYIARMDAHTIYPPRYLAAGIARLAREDAVGQVSGPQLAAGTGTWSRRIALALSSPLGAGGAGFRRELHEEVEVDTGFTGLWRAETLRELGGWDEEWVNDQDLELAARLRASGRRIVCIPEMAASYIPRSSLSGLARQYQTYGIYRVKSALRHPESLRRSQLLPPALTGSVVLATVPGTPLRRPAQGAVLAYGAALGVATMRSLPSAGTDALWLSPIFTTMHVSYGVGFIRGCLRFGPPLAALRSALRTSQRGS
jgi:succinoglycan biosynthesis protein ExoA